jgi:hypothetical protein
MMKPHQKIALALVAIVLPFGLPLAALLAAYLRNKSRRLSAF